MDNMENCIENALNGVLGLLEQKNVVVNEERNPLLSAAQRKFIAIKTGAEQNVKDDRILDVGIDTKHNGENEGLKDLVFVRKWMASTPVEKKDEAKLNESTAAAVESEFEEDVLNVSGITAGSLKDVDEAQEDLDLIAQYEKDYVDIANLTAGSLKDVDEEQEELDLIAQYEKDYVDPANMTSGSLKDMDEAQEERNLLAKYEKDYVDLANLTAGSLKDVDEEQEDRDLIAQYEKDYVDIANLTAGSLKDLEPEELHQSTVAELEIEEKKEAKPTGWSTSTYHKAVHLAVSHDGHTVTHRGYCGSVFPAAVRANTPIPHACGTYYFEVRVVYSPTGCLGVGLSRKEVDINRLPGWDEHSYGYHGDDGCFFSTDFGRRYANTYGTGDVVGCGINFIDNYIFFTKNGVSQGIAMRQLRLNEPLYPVVGLQSGSDIIEVNFGHKEFVFDLCKDIKKETTDKAVEMVNALKTEDEEWDLEDDVEDNESTDVDVEQDDEEDTTPTGWSISSVHKAKLLSVTNNNLRVTNTCRNVGGISSAVRANAPIPKDCGAFYFEVHVVYSPSGSVGLGVCTKGVSMKRMPGWEAHSYGYHGDDGSFFTGSGIGSRYGETFHTGDVVGCGVNFIDNYIFFTKNGRSQGVALRQLDHNEPLYPVVGLYMGNDVIEVNFGQMEFAFDTTKDIQKEITVDRVQEIELVDMVKVLKIKEEESDLKGDTKSTEDDNTDNDEDNETSDDVYSDSDSDSNDSSVQSGFPASSDDDEEDTEEEEGNDKADDLDESTATAVEPEEKTSDLTVESVMAKMLDFDYIASIMKGIDFDMFKQVKNTEEDEEDVEMEFYDDNWGLEAIPTERDTKKETMSSAEEHKAEHSGKGNRDDETDDKNEAPLTFESVMAKMCDFNYMNQLVKNIDLDLLKAVSDVEVDPEDFDFFEDWRVEATGMELETKKESLDSENKQEHKYDEKEEDHDDEADDGSSDATDSDDTDDEIYMLADSDDSSDSWEKTIYVSGSSDEDEEDDDLEKVKDQQKLPVAAEESDKKENHLEVMKHIELKMKKAQKKEEQELQKEADDVQENVIEPKGIARWFNMMNGLSNLSAAEQSDVLNEMCAEMKSTWF